MEYFMKYIKVAVSTDQYTNGRDSRPFHLVVTKTADPNSPLSFWKKKKIHGAPVEAIRLPTGDNCGFESTSTYRFFSHRKHTYIWRSNSSAPNFGDFVELPSLDSKSQCDTLVNSTALSGVEAAGRRAVYGPNEILVKVKPIWYLVFLDALNPFYVFQLFSVCVWCSEQYFYYAGCIVVISVASVVYQVYQTRQNQSRLRNTVHSVSEVTLLRPTSDMPLVKLDETYNVATYAHKSSSKVVVSSTVLVPGDLILIPRIGCTLQCDALLLNGDCIVNESMLTGESVPVTKTPMLYCNDGSLYSSRLHARQTLFSGTTVLQTKVPHGQDCVALVLRTGFRTTKGQLVRSIMYPKEVDFRFISDLLKFVAVLAGIAAIGFIYTIALMTLRGNGFSLIAKRALDIITIVVPPALPAVMTIGIMSARKRLEKANIFCISPNTINTCGAIDCVCFDKTGTLTEDNLSFMSAVPAESGAFLAESHSIDPDGPICAAMATCHSLINIDDQLLGDPIDMALFSSTLFQIFENTGDSRLPFTIAPQTVVSLEATKRQMSTIIRLPSEDQNKSYDNSAFELEALARQSSMFAPHQAVEIGIMRQFPFGLNLQRMSVITQKPGQQHFVLYCKGAPEMIVSLSKRESIPSNFVSILSQYTSEGYRVLAIGQRSFANSDDVVNISRDEAERDLQFLGLLVLENRLKAESAPVLLDLRQANIRTNMVTGDNIETAVSVALNCGMLSRSKAIFTVKIDERNGSIGLEKMSETEHLGDFSQSHLEENRLFKDYGSMASSTGMKSPNFQLAISGHTYGLVRKNDANLARKLVALTTVWARMSPESKATLVTDLQDLGYVVSMCGDGANDCSALKAAHAGISLSEAEASIASPFTSKTANISCVPVLIREGRCALVTSFGVFKFMALYSLSQFFSVCLLYWISSDLADFQFLFEDLYLVTTLGIFFGNTAAAKKLSSEPPPTRVLSVESVSSILTQVVVLIVFQLLIFYYVSLQPWFIPLTDPQDNNNYVAHQVTAVFLLSSFQYITFSIIYSKSFPHRRSILSNLPFTASIVVLTSTSIWITLNPPVAIRDLLNLKSPPFMAFRGLILLLAAINFASAFILETVLVDIMLKLLNRSKWLSQSVTPEHELIINQHGKSAEWINGALLLS